MTERRNPLLEPAAQGLHLDTLEPRVADALRLILRIAGGDFTARGDVSTRSDEIDAIVVGLNMLAESFERERLARDRAEALLADAIDSYENAPGLFCSVDAATFAVVKSNQTLADAVGTTKAALEGRSILELCNESSRLDLERALRALTTTENVRARVTEPPAANVRVPEIELARSDGRELVVSVTGSVLRDVEGRPARLRLSLRDVTNERRLETQLLHSQKMDAIGQLAGGVAHDFNNLLMVIQSATSLLGRRITPDTSQAALLGQVQEAAGRAAALTRQLLTFARREVARPSTVDVGQLILRNQAMLARLLGSSIALDVQVSEGHKPVHIDPTRLEQALMNMVINARDAMPTGGALSIAVDELMRRPHASKVRITVTDTGQGIAPEHKSRIFEPFFTTKPPGGGTGLGLAMAYGIVTQAGGEMHVYSERGKGACFELLLPAAAQEATPLSNRARPMDPQGGTETVLVVEDEPSVRALMVSILSEVGYTVHEAKSGSHALALSRAVLESTALVISDVIMPGMPGTVLIETLRAQYPKLRCMLMSGYPADHQIGGPWFLAKPFDPSVLLRMVRERLDVAE